MTGMEHAIEQETIVNRAYSPSRDRAGSAYVDRVRAVSQAAVRNQFVECDPESVWPADWFVQAGRVVWGIDE